MHINAAALAKAIQALKNPNASFGGEYNHSFVLTGEEGKAVFDLLAMDTPWSLVEVLSKLVAATNHLLYDHSCDAHGHEEYRTAALRGEQILKDLTGDQHDST